MKNIWIYGALMVLTVNFISCEDDRTHLENTQPVFVSAYPQASSVHQLVTILGRYFGTDRSAVKVYFDDKEATLVEFSTDALQVITPEGSGDVAVKIVVGGVTLDGGIFSYQKPTIQYKVTTLAGNGASGWVDGTGDIAQFNNPEGVAVDAAGNVYVADRTNNAIRKITPTGQVSTISGNGTKGYQDGPVTSALFNFPWKLDVDAQGNIFVAERDNDRIRKIGLNMVSTIAGSSRGYAEGNGSAAKFNQPIDVAVAADGTLYVADNNNHRIRKILPDGTVSTLAGSTSGYADGIAAAAKFNTPSGVAIGPDGNIYVADRGNHSIRKVTPEGVVTTVAGTQKAGAKNGVAKEATFNQPYGIDVNDNGDIVIADLNNNMIRFISTAGEVSTIAGSSEGFADGFGAAAKFSSPTDVTFGQNGKIFVADLANKRIRQLSLID